MEIKELINEEQLEQIKNDVKFINALPCSDRNSVEIAGEIIEYKLVLALIRGRNIDSWYSFINYILSEEFAFDYNTLSEKIFGKETPYVADNRMIRNLINDRTHTLRDYISCPIRRRGENG